MHNFPHIRIDRRIGGSLILIVSILCCLLPNPLMAEERQYKIEAAYLYNFFNYITWPGYTSPQELQQPVICVHTNDPILPYLHYIRSKIANERKLTIRSVTEGQNAVGCHILFMRHRVTQKILLPDDTLTVFKPDDPLDRGGMIELSEDGERITIKIHQSLLERGNFAVSSRLLDLAQRAK